MLFLLTIVLACTIGGISAQDFDCDFVLNVTLSQNLTASSPGYPQNYTAGVNCRWIVVCPAGYNCVANCTLGLPQTENCTLDRLLISRSGDNTLAGAQALCGNGTYSTVSSEQRMTIGLMTSTQSPGGRFLCDLYAQEQAPTTPAECTCGYRRNTRIVGGQETVPNEFTMMAGLAFRGRWQLDQETVIFCGGVIISERYVLTAAHCLTNIPSFEILVVVGAHNISSANETTVQRLSVIEYTINSNYNPSRSNNPYDVGILTTNGAITFNQFVGPVCLPFKFQRNSFIGSSLTILGWGTTSATGATSDVLQRVVVRVISRTSCRVLRRASVPNHQICTYSRGSDACQYDSGGPLLYTDPSTGLLFNIGVVSFGRFCAERRAPAVNTHVPRLLDWIIANTPGAQYCEK